MSKERPIEILEELLDEVHMIVNEMVITTDMDERYELALKFRKVYKEFIEG